MGKYRKLLFRILHRTSDADIPFQDLCILMKQLGFQERIKGSHHIFSKEDIPEILNFQPKGSRSKPYQVKQIREIILKYRLGDIVR